MTTPSPEPVLAGSAASPGAPSAPVVAGSLAAPSLRRRLGLHFGVVLLAAGGVGAALGGMPMAVSALFGVALAALNLLFLRRITSVLAGGGGAAWLVLLPFKLIGLVGVAYALVAAKVAQPVPLAAGFALLPLTAVFLPRPTSPLAFSSRVVYPATIPPGRAGNH